MGANRFFWSQELLDQWLGEEKILLDGDRLTVISEKSSYRLSQAVYFKKDVGDGKDLHRLVGRVKELGALEAMGAEHYMDSVLIGESAYQVAQGFTGMREGKEAEMPLGRSRDISGAIAKHTGDETDADDRELLARFLIKNL